MIHGTGVDDIIKDLGIKGFVIGSMIGFIFEVFLVRNNGKVRWIVSALSILAMGMMGFLSWEIAHGAFPTSAWKPSVWTIGATANTWWFARFALSGDMFKLVLDAATPEKLKQFTKRRDDDS